MAICSRTCHQIWNMLLWNGLSKHSPTGEGGTHDPRVRDGFLKTLGKAVFELEVRTAFGRDDHISVEMCYKFGTLRIAPFKTR